MVFASNLRGENGDFEYIVSNDKVLIHLADIYDGDVVSTWTLSFADNGLTDPDGRVFRHSTEEERELIMAWYTEWHGGAAEGTIDLSEVKENIIVANGSTLTGTLEVRSYGLASGLFGSSYRNAGNLEIQSGTIKAYGYVFSSGIGAGMIYNCGNITISGGTVIAEGGKSSVGIGGSGDLAGAGRCGDITITGGDVYASGGKYAAGIGSGYCSSGIYHIYKSINISGGIVLAYGGEDGAGIGTGAKSPTGTHFDSGIINITGGDIESHGSGKGAGIGAGKDNKCGTINVNINSGNTLKAYTEGYFDHENYDYEHWAGGVGSCDLSNCDTLNIGLGVAVSYCVGKKTPYTEEKFIYLKLADDRAGIVHKQGGVRFETCPHFEYEDYPELCMYCTHL